MQLNEVKQLITDFIPTLTDADAVFVTGDFNSIPTSAAVMLMKKSGNFSDTWELHGQGDGFTFNSAKPFERIDYVFLKPFNSFPCQKNIHSRHTSFFRSSSCDLQKKMGMTSREPRPHWPPHGSNGFCVCMGERVGMVRDGGSESNW